MLLLIAHTEVLLGYPGACGAGDHAWHTCFEANEDVAFSKPQVLLNVTVTLLEGQLNGLLGWADRILYSLQRRALGTLTAHKDSSYSNMSCPRKSDATVRAQPAGICCSGAHDKHCTLMLIGMMPGSLSTDA